MLKYFLLFFAATLFLFLPAGSVKAQNGVYFIPSARQAGGMREVLSGTGNDTLKIEANYYLSSYYTELNKDSAEYFADLQLNIAKKLNQKLWVADADFQLAYITYGLSNYPKSLNAITDRLAITNNIASEKNNWRAGTFSGDGNAHRARLFIAAALHLVFAFLYTHVDDRPKAIAEFNTAIKISEPVGNKAELSLDYMSLGSESADENKPDPALLLEKKALSYLKVTQQQLIQAEKTASLGELTAGIAQEIQNPLNFVNNFSEVNKEMPEDLKAESIKPKAERDEQLESELINDLIENEGKINHHQ